MFTDCLILGDSIAVGVGQDRPGCTTVARTGINSTAFIQALLPAVPKDARSVVISLGVNDSPAMNTADALRRLRQSLQSRHVTWLLPGPRDDVRRAIRQVAEEHGDHLVDTGGELGPDHLHPTGTGYRRIAAATADIPGPPTQTTPAVSRPVVLPQVHYGLGMRIPLVIYLPPPSNLPAPFRTHPVAMTALPALSPGHPAGPAKPRPSPTAY